MSIFRFRETVQAKPSGKEWLKSVFLGLLGLSSSVITSTGADMLDAWHWRNPSPFADTMQSICFGNGKFVAVGEGGVIHWSTDGIGWDDGQRFLPVTLNRVFFGNGQFVAVGDAGAIFTS